MHAALRWTGLPQLYSFYRHFAFNVPRATTGGGTVLLVGIAAVHLYRLFSAQVPRPAYAAVYFAVVGVVALASCAGMIARSKPLVVKASWALGSVTAAVVFALYIVSRTAGLPGLATYVGQWDYPLGTFMLLLAAGFVALHGTVVTGINVAWPQWRDWHE